MEDRTEMLDDVADYIVNYYPNIVHYCPDYKAELDYISQVWPDKFQAMYEEAMYGATDDVDQVASAFPGAYG